MTITSSLRFLYILGGSGLLCAAPHRRRAETSACRHFIPPSDFCMLLRGKILNFFVFLFTEYIKKQPDSTYLCKSAGKGRSD